MDLINFFSKDMRWIIDVKTSPLNDGAGADRQRLNSGLKSLKLCNYRDCLLTHSILPKYPAVSIKMRLQLCVCSPDGHLIKLNRDQLLPS